MEIPSFCQLRVTAFAMGMLSVWASVAAIGRLHLLLRKMHGALASTKTECACAMTAVATGFPFVSSEINAYARKITSLMTSKRSFADIASELFSLRCGLSEREYPIERTR